MESWLTLAAVSIALKLAPVRTVRRSITRAEPANGSTKVPADLLETFGIALRNHLLRFNCLPRSLALQRLFRRRGIEARLCIGARTIGGRLDGHAWVEVGGQPIGEPSGVAEMYPPLSGNPAEVGRWI